jgi:hypothetical protein
MTQIAIHPIAGEDIVQHFVGKFEADGQRAPCQLIDVLGQGSFFVLAPVGTDESRLRRLNTGRLLPVVEVIRRGGYILERVASTAGFLAQIIYDEFHNGKFSVFIREPYLKPGDRSEILNELSFVGDSKYKIIDVRLTDEVSLTEAIKLFTVSWSFLLIVAAHSGRCKNASELVSEAILIAVNAYDGESYLYWRKDSPERLFLQ